MIALISRLAALAIALCGIFWGAAAIFAGSETRPVDTMALGLTSGFSYPVPEMSGALQGEDGRLFGLCRPRRLRSIAIVKLSIFERAAIQNSADASSLAHEARDAIRAALACAPQDGFLWLTMFNLDAYERPLTPRLEYLDLSRKIAPNEGWIIARRAMIGLHVWGSLDEHLRQSTLADFGQLFDNRAYDYAADIVAGVDGEPRLALLQSLHSANSSMLGAFAQLLLDRGVRDKSIGWLTAAEAFHR